jgi:hypothetical protein
MNSATYARATPQSSTSSSRKTISVLPRCSALLVQQLCPLPLPAATPQQLCVRAPLRSCRPKQVCPSPTAGTALHSSSNPANTWVWPAAKGGAELRSGAMGALRHAGLSRTVMPEVAPCASQYPTSGKGGLLSFAGAGGTGEVAPTAVISNVRTHDHQMTSYLAAAIIFCH